MKHTITFSKVLAFVFSSYKKHFGVMLGVGLLAAVNTVLYQQEIKIVGEHITQLVDVKKALYTEEHGEGSVLAGKKLSQEQLTAFITVAQKDWFLFIGIVLFFFINLLFVLGFSSLGLMIVDKKEVTFKDVLAQIWSLKNRITSILGLTVFLALYFVGCILPIAFIAFGLNFLVKSYLSVMMAQILMAVAFIIPMIFVIRWMFGYSFAPIILVDKPELSIRQALSSSQELIDGLRSKLFTVLMGFGLLSLVILLPVAFIMNKISLEYSTIVSIGVSSLFTVVTYLVLAVLYRSYQAVQE